jgi:hypothetical protein
MTGTGFTGADRFWEIGFESGAVVDEGWEGGGDGSDEFGGGGGERGEEGGVLGKEGFDFFGNKRYFFHF